MASIGPSTRTGVASCCEVGGSLGQAEQLLALGEDRRASRVQVLRAGELVVVLRRVASADEADQVAAGVDREDEAVAERVDQAAALGLAGEAGVDQFLDRRPAAVRCWIRLVGPGGA